MVLFFAVYFSRPIDSDLLPIAPIEIDQLPVSEFGFSVQLLPLNKTLAVPEIRKAGSGNELDFRFHL